MNLMLMKTGITSMSSDISGGRKRQSANGEAPNVAREKICEAFVMQHVHVTLGET